MGSADLLLLIKAKDEAAGILGNVTKSLVAVGLAAAGAALLFVKAAAEEEIGMKQLEVAVNNTGRSWKELRGEGVTLGDQIEKNITALQDMSGVADSEMRPALALLIAQTGSLDEAMNRLPLALDLSRGANIDLATASRLLGKLTDENVNVFKRMGLTFGKNATELQVLQAVQEKFAGQSAAYASTAAGQWDVLRHKVADFVEEVGFKLLPMATTAIGILGEMFGVVTGKAPEAGGKLREAVGGPMAEAVMGALAMVRDTAQLIFNGDFPALINKVIAFVGDAVPKINAQLLRWGHEFIAWVGPQIPILLGELFKMLGQALQWVADHKVEIQAELKKWGVLFGEFIHDVAIPALQVALPGIVETLIAFATTVPGLVNDAFMAVGKGIVDSVATAIRESWEGIAEAFRYMLSQALASVDFWVGPFHVSGLTGITLGSGWGIDLISTLQGAASKVVQIVSGGSETQSTGHATGGFAEYTGLHWLERGEPVGAQAGGSGVTVVFNGPTYGMADFEDKVASIFRDRRLAGGFRGVR